MAKQKTNLASVVHYFRIDRKLLAQCRRVEKISKVKFSDFLTQEAIRFINKFGEQEELFAALDTCFVCKKVGDFELNSIVDNDKMSIRDKNEEIISICFLVVCPDCKKRILVSQDNNLNEIEQSIKQRLTDTDRIESDGTDLTEWSCWSELYNGEIKEWKYAIQEPGKVLLENS